MATGAAASTVNIGNTTGASAVVVRVGTGNYSLDGAATSTYSVGASTTSGTITIGGTAQTGTMKFGSSSGNYTVNLGDSTGAGVATVNIGSGVNGNTISIGNGINTGAQIINIAGGAAGANSTVNVLSGNATLGTQTLNLCRCVI